jgi:hypothetical protein
MLRMFRSVSCGPQADEDYAVCCVQNVWGVALKQTPALHPISFPGSYLALSDIFRRDCVIEYQIIHLYQGVRIDWQSCSVLIRY